MNKVLILGGTNFIGRNLVERLITNSNFEVSLFNRGVTNSNLFPNVKKIIGNREIETELNQIFSADWDYVIDLSCYYPKSLSWITDKINKNITKYIFISTISVYDNQQYKGMLRDESAPILSCLPSEAIDKSTNTYGKRKAACELILKNSNIPFIIFRPALVFGPYDSTDRFYYWIYQIKNNKQIIVPEKGERKLSLTYVDDLVNSIINSLTNNRINDVYNCISYPEMSIDKIITVSTSVLNREVKRINTSAKFLNEENIEQWFSIPLWLNTDDYTYSNKHICDHLNFTPTAFLKSLKKTINYFDSLNYPKPIYGISNSKQEELIEKLH